MLRAQYLTHTKRGQAYGWRLPYWKTYQALGAGMRPRYVDGINSAGDMGGGALSQLSVTCNMVDKVM